MKTFIGFILFLLTLPFVAALGYDLYLYYNTNWQEFHLVGIGWIVLTYAPEIHSNIMLSIGDNKQLLELYGTLMEFKATIAGLVLALFSYAFVFLISTIVKIFKSGSKKVTPTHGHKKGAKNAAPHSVDDVLGRHHEEMEYKRK